MNIDHRTDLDQSRQEQHESRFDPLAETQAKLGRAESAIRTLLTVIGSDWSFQGSHPMREAALRRAREVVGVDQDGSPDLHTRDPRAIRALAGVPVMEAKRIARGQVLLHFLQTSVELDDVKTLIAELIVDNYPRLPDRNMTTGETINWDADPEVVG